MKKIIKTAIVSTLLLGSFSTAFAQEISLEQIVNTEAKIEAAIGETQEAQKLTPFRTLLLKVLANDREYAAKVLEIALSKKTNSGRMQEDIHDIKLAITNLAKMEEMALATTESDEDRSLQNELFKIRTRLVKMLNDIEYDLQSIN